MKVFKRVLFGVCFGLLLSFNLMAAQPILVQPAPLPQIQQLDFNQPIQNYYGQQQQRNYQAEQDRRAHERYQQEYRRQQQQQWERQQEYIRQDQAEELQRSIDRLTRELSQ